MLPPFLAYAGQPLLERYGEGVEARLKVCGGAAARHGARRCALRSVRSSGPDALLPCTHRPQLNPLRRSLAFSFVLAEKYRVRGRAAPAAQRAGHGSASSAPSVPAVRPD